MKKGIIVVFIIMLIVLIGHDKSSEVLIPKDAIRFRIIANSNSLVDQNEKYNIKKDLEPTIASILSESSSLTESRKLINNNMDEINSIISKHTKNYNVNYGINYFPEKTYKGVTYEAGNYESLVVTLGDGLGDNWWCVLFPPLCLLEASSEELDDVTYSFYIKDIINKF